ncbi:hypothetical protein SRHO_G00123470 [Serrasalmus rhombeus]
MGSVCCFAVGHAPSAIVLFKRACVLETEKLQQALDKVKQALEEEEAQLRGTLMGLGTEHRACPIPREGRRSPVRGWVLSALPAQLQMGLIVCWRSSRSPLQRGRASGKRQRGRSVRDGLAPLGITLMTEHVAGRLEKQHGLWLQCEVPATPWGPDERRTAQEEDAELNQVRQWLRGRCKPEWSMVTPLGPAMKALYSQWRSLMEREGLLYHHWESPVPRVVVLQLLVPRALRGTVLQTVHGQDGVGHFGTTKTLRRLRQGFYWPGCSHDVELFVRCCTVCTAKKGPAEHSHTPLQTLRSGAPMERVGVDVLGPFPETERGNKYVLVAMDYFTKWPKT